MSRDRSDDWLKPAVERSADKSGSGVPTWGSLPWLCHDWSIGWVPAPGNLLCPVEFVFTAPEGQSVGWGFLKCCPVLAGSVVVRSLLSWLWFNSAVTLGKMSSTHGVYLWPPHCLWEAGSVAYSCFLGSLGRHYCFLKRIAAVMALLPTSVGNVCLCKIFFTTRAETLTKKHSLTHTCGFLQGSSSHKRILFR